MTKTPPPAQPPPVEAHLQASDLRAATRLATEATAGIVDLVEAVHARVAQVALPGAAIDTRTRGITGFVYKVVRGVTHGVAKSLDAALAALTPLLGGRDEAALPTAEREAVLSALNGVLGDHLEASANPLAITMTLRHQARPLVLERAALAAAFPQNPTQQGSKLVVLLHGLCMNDRQWTREGHDHGAALARDAGWTPLYLHYNSGLPIARNGAMFASLMEQLLAQWPQPLQRLALIGHSMGGLVARSALFAADQGRMAWPAQLGDLICLGSPHQGAPLERAGHGVDLLLGASSYSAAFARLTKLRSAGITDLRHGRVVADPPGDKGGNTSNTSNDNPAPLPLPERVRCHTVAASLGRDEKDLKHLLMGDGLVPLDSALGRDADATRALAFAPERQTVVYETGHLDMLSSPAVYAAIRQALS